MEKMKIEGIKLSEALFAVTFRNLVTLEDCMSRIYEILVENHVNLVFLSRTNINENSQVLFCITSKDQAQVRDIIESEPDMSSHAEFIFPAGSLSVFHHQFSLKILGLVLKIFSSMHLPLYGLASSLSTLTLITDYGLLTHAVNAIREYLDVPSDQIYLRPEKYVLQTQDERK
jgi:hypothetical protein